MIQSSVVLIVMHSQVFPAWCMLFSAQGYGESATRLFGRENHDERQRYCVCGSAVFPDHVLTVLCSHYQELGLEFELPMSKVLLNRGLARIQMGEKSASSLVLVTTSDAPEGHELFIMVIQHVLTSCQFIHDLQIAFKPIIPSYSK